MLKKLNSLSILAILTAVMVVWMLITIYKAEDTSDDFSLLFPELLYVIEPCIFLYVAGFPKLDDCECISRLRIPEELEKTAMEVNVTFEPEPGARLTL